VRRKVGPVTNVLCAIAVATVALFGCIAECPAAPARQKNATPPMPPPRPAESIDQDHPALPNSRGLDVRETTRAPGSTTPAGSKDRTPPQNLTAPEQTAPRGATNALPPQVTDTVFPSLPATSRARMRDCGREWQEMKRTGHAKELTWRDFATQCLTR
jgi:hypothetical protein